MPEPVSPDKYVSQVPRFVLPKDLTNPEATPKEIKETPVAPAEPPKEAKPATEAVATPSTEPPEVEPEKDKDPEKASQRRFERRIDRAHRARAEAQARTEILERELSELKAKQAPVVSPSKPKVTDFTDIGEFETAVDKWARSEALREHTEKQRTEASKSAQLRLAQDWSAKVERGYVEHDDFEEQVGNLQPTTPWARAIMRSENGEEVAYYLAKHRPEAEKIFNLDPESQYLEIGKISFRLTQKVEAPKTPSKAPPPIAPITGAGSVPDDDAFKPQPPEEYMRKGNKLFRGR